MSWATQTARMNLGSKLLSPSSRYYNNQCDDLEAILIYSYHFLAGGLGRGAEF